MSLEKESLLFPHKDLPGCIFLHPEEAGKFFALEEVADELEALPVNEYLDGARFTDLLAEEEPVDRLSLIAKK